MAQHHRRRLATATAVALVAIIAACSGDDDDATQTTVEVPTGYVALGDSFSAGVGAPPAADPGECGRSDQAFAQVLDDQLDDLELLELRACGGARTEHLLGPWDSRSEPAQIPDAPDDEVALVTVTIGGNDVGFSDLVAACVLDDCSDVPTSAEFTADLATLTATLVDDVYPALRTAYPAARIVHVGYPRLTPPTGPIPAECGWLSADEQPATAAIVDTLNAAIEDAVDTAADDNLFYADVGGAFAGHELCTEDPWVNPLTLAPERAHPTAAGYEAIAAAIADSLTQLSR